MIWLPSMGKEFHAPQQSVVCSSVHEYVCVHLACIVCCVRQLMCVCMCVCVVPNRFRQNNRIFH